jgi:hypothetical protein
VPLPPEDEEGRRRRRFFWMFLGGPVLALFAIKAAVMIWRMYNR